METTRIADLSGPRRLALGLFLATWLGFYGLAQVKLVTSAGQGRSIPGPAAVLALYHGDPTKSRLHHVLDPTLPSDDPLRMYPYLGASEEECAANRAKVLAWVEKGSPRAEWPTVSAVFTGANTCGLCHSKALDDEGKPRSRSDLPFDTVEQVQAATKPDTGMSTNELTTSSHNHLFGFAVGALIVSWIFAGTRWRGPLVPLLVAGAFVGGFLDVVSWWLTKLFGSPFEWLVIGAGGLYGLSMGTMAALALDEIVLRGRASGWLSRPLSKLRIGRFEA